MRCEDVRPLLDRGEVSEEALDHLETCDACAAIAEEKGLLADGIEPDADEALLARTRGRIDADANAAGWLKSRPTWLRGTIAVSIATIILLFALILMRRPDFDDYPTWRMVGTLAAMFILLAASLLLGLRPAHHPMLPPWVSRGLTTVGIVVAFVFAAMPTMYVPVKEYIGDDPLHAMGMPCLYLGVMMGVPVYAIARLLDRGGNPISAVLAAIAAGLTGNLVLQIHCPRTDPLHQIFGHFTVVIVFVLAAGALVWIERRLRNATSAD